MEPEETHDYVREAKDMHQENAEEISFVPSAISVPQKPLFRCDNHCNEKTLIFWHFASAVIKEGEDHTRPSYASNVTTSIWRHKGKSLTNWQWFEVVEKKGASWKAVENDWK